MCVYLCLTFNFHRHTLPRTPKTQLWKGACNKNLGNSFLLIWRIGEEEKLLNVSRSLWSTGGACVYLCACVYVYVCVPIARTIPQCHDTRATPDT